ncbi:hypothetical protein [Methylobacterium brachiatum]|uniref:hypothetical protein n=1 Tax=Methylobacterium brachiatum TaxID=269660 RepID=UPI000EFD284B|nr:hypothetical protein [Methylobacterium brachiatum]AYO83550.1 hypothetical protein EBB05_15600 [Methylobacterium brachiatum]
MTPEYLSAAEEEFIAEMALERDYPSSGWHSFDPDFRQRDIARLFRRGWFERRGTGRDREYRWTEAGQAQFAKSAHPAPVEET